MVYVNQHVENELSKVQLSEYCKKESFVNDISQPLKKHVLEGNLNFDKELIDFQVEKSAKQIVDKLKQRTDIVSSYTNTSQ